MMRHLRILTLFFQDVFQRRLTNLVHFLNGFINPLVLLLFWQGILTGEQQLNGWTIHTIRTYYILLIVAEIMLLHKVEYLVGYYDIKQGELVSLLLKPISYLKVRLIAETPWRIMQGMYGTIAIIILVSLFHIQFVWEGFARFPFHVIVIVLLAYFLSFFYKMVLGLSAFWFVTIDGILETNEVLIMTLGGLVIPVNLFPESLSRIVHLTPFPYMLYYPIVAFIGNIPVHDLNAIIRTQIIWIGALYVVTKILWFQGLKKFSGVGQ